jgi:hypothetical protein
MALKTVFHCPVCLRARGEVIYYAPRQRHCVICRCESLEPFEPGSVGQARCTPEDFLHDPGASFWLKEAIRSALRRDPVDAANDSEILARFLVARCRSILGRS